MGLFSHKCPECGGKLEATGYAFPYPTHRCANCIRMNNEMKKRRALEKRVRQLEENVKR